MTHWKEEECKVCINGQAFSLSSFEVLKFIRVATQNASGHNCMFVNQRNTYSYNEIAK